MSVIIPVYNSASRITASIASVLTQTRHPFEVIVVDDGSTDATPRLARGFPEGVRYLRKQNGGAASARNHGLLHSKGEWVAFLDADDSWLAHKLERQLALAFAAGADLVFSDATVHSTFAPPSPSWLEGIGARPALLVANSPTGLATPLHLLIRLGCFILPSTVLVRRRCLADEGFFDETLRCAEDFDLWLRLSRTYRFALCPEALAVRRVHGANTGGDRWQAVSGAMRVYDSLANDPRVTDPGSRRALRIHRARLLREQGTLLLERAAMADARRAWAHSFRLSLSFRVALYWLATLLPPTLIRGLQAGKRWWARRRAAS